MNWYWSLTSDPLPEPDELDCERVRVSMLLKAFDLGGSEGKLRARHAKQHDGVKRLTFESFDHFFPTFPWQMTSKHLYDLKDPFTALRPPGKVREWYAKYNAHFQACCQSGDASQDRPLAMAFTVGHIHRKGLIIHNGPPQTKRNRWLGELELLDGVKVKVCVEHYPAWLRAVAATDWTPDTPTVVHQGPEQETDGDSVVAPVEKHG